MDILHAISNMSIGVPFPNLFSVFLILILILVCYSISPNVMETSLTVISSLCGLLFLSKRDGSGKEIFYAIVPGFVRRRRLVRFDSSEPISKSSLTESNEEEFNQEKEPTVPSNLSRKSCRKAKKKKNFAKSKYKMDDATDGKSELAPKRDAAEKTKVYTPLKVYLDLNLDEYTLYHEFRQLLMQRDLRTFYEFPMAASHYSGGVVLSPKYRKASPERSCCRCGTTFKIHPDGRYDANTVCQYHPVKSPPYRANMECNNYSCCNGDYMSLGCVTWQYHVTAESHLNDSDFVRVREKKHLSAQKSCTLYALDCEMIYTTNGFEVAKVGIVGLDGLTVYETLVLPENQILCYNTLYSGVSEKDLKNVTTTLRDVQAYLLKLINRDSILVGHGLENDLRALRLVHDNVVDTSSVFPHARGVPFRRNLKSLAKEHLDKRIQESPSGHDCIEDARTCMELVLRKIQSELKDRPPVLLDENKNSVLQNLPPLPKVLVHPWEVQYFYEDSYQVSSFFPDQSCRRNSMQRPYFSDRYIPRTRCYAYS